MMSLGFFASEELLSKCVPEDIVKLSVWRGGAMIIAQVGILLSREDA